MDPPLKEVLNGGFGPGCPSSTPTPPTVNLMRLYKEITRSELCKHTIESIYKLCDHHLSCNNYVEAGMTLKLHANKLNWSWDAVPPDTFSALIGSHGPTAAAGDGINCGNGNNNNGNNNNNGSSIQRSQQFEWQLKESLFMTIIEYFDRAKCWEESILMMKELSEFYEKKSFDYFKWSQLLRQQAQFLDNILNLFRPESEYFRVGFYGSNFPAFLRNKSFIYRGHEFEKIAAFTERLQTEFPSATLITKSGQIDESLHEKDGQWMQITSVKPVMTELRPEFEGRDVPDKVLTYFMTNRIDTFICDRPLHKGQVDRDNEFKSLWIERSTLVTAEKLPSTLRWSEIVSKRITELSPIEHACETVENMNRELQKLIVSYSNDPSMAISPLSMRLQGVIEAAVNGGVAKYQEAFFNAKYIHLHPEQGPFIRRLKNLILQKVRILEGGLSLHGRLAPTNIQPLQRRLLERLTLMRQNVMEASANVMDAGGMDFGMNVHRRNPSIIHQPLPPIPVLEPVTGHEGSSSMSSLPRGVHVHNNSNSDGGRRSFDTYQAPNNGNNSQSSSLDGAINNNYHDVIYAVPTERSNSSSYHQSSDIANRTLPDNIDGLVLTDGTGNIIDVNGSRTSPPPLPPKRPKRPRSSNNTCSSVSSGDAVVLSPTPGTPPPPRPPIPAGISSNNSSIDHSNNTSSHASPSSSTSMSMSMDRSSGSMSNSLLRSRSIPRSANSFQLSNLMMASPPTSHMTSSNNVQVNGNLYTPSPTRFPSCSSSASIKSPDLMSPEVPPRSHPGHHHHHQHQHTLAMDSDSKRMMVPKEVLNNNNHNVNTIPKILSSASSSSFQSKESFDPKDGRQEDEEKPILPPKTVRKTISSNQLDAPLPQTMNSVISNNNLRLSGSSVSNVTSISVNGSNSRTSTLPNRRPPPPTPPSSASPPPPHHPPPPAPPLSSAEESELLSMSLASNLSILDGDNDTFIEHDTSTPSVMAAKDKTLSISTPISGLQSKSGSSGAVSVITVNTVPVCTSIRNEPSFDPLNPMNVGSAPQVLSPQPSTIIRVTSSNSNSSSSVGGNAANENSARKSSQSLGSESSSSSSSCPLTFDDVKGV